MLLHGAEQRGIVPTQLPSEVSCQRLLLHHPDEVAPVIRKATRTLGLTTMISSESDLQGSTDVFPVKFLDMQRHHVLLTGRDVLSDLSITRDHLRLRCEQEIKNLSLRLRSRYIQAHGKPKLMRRTLTRAIQPFSTSIRVLGQLKTGDEPPSDTDTLTSDAKTLDLDGHTLQEVLTLSRSKHGGRSAELKDLYGRFMRVVQQAAIIADEL